MALPGNGIFVVRGEMSTLMTAMRRGAARWSSTSYQDDEQDGLMKQFIELKQILNQIDDLKLIDPNVYLGPFLDVIRTEETTGAVTSLALSAINKFLSYGLIDPTHSTLSATVENIADAVTHARFMGTDQSSDGVTLMRVVEVLHTLMRSPEGSALTNESVCEVMLSCFKICFEPRLNELLRRTAEQALKDMVLLLFMRLPQFSEDRHPSGLLRKFKMTTPATPGGNIVDMQGRITKTPVTNSTTAATAVTTGQEDADVAGNESIGQNAGDNTEKQNDENVTDNDANVENEIVEGNVDAKDGGGEKIVNSVSGSGNIDGEYINSVGVRFTQQNSFDADGANPLLPYGLPCIQELFRFLILLCNPLDKQNTDTMTHMGLSLLTVAFEVGADNIGKYHTLLALVKDEMCRNLFALLNSERLTIFAADLQVCFLLFESLRSHLKFQLEHYLTKLMEIIGNENPRQPSYEFKELALDNLLQLWRIPGFVAELYVNYDCNLYCTDMFENLTKLLSKITLSATNSIYSIHSLSLDALLCVIESIEKNCLASKLAGCNTITINSSRHHSRNNSTLEGITIINDRNNVAMTTGSATATTITMNKSISNENSSVVSIDNKNNEDDGSVDGSLDENFSGNIENLSTFIKNYAKDNNNKRFNLYASLATPLSVIMKITKDELKHLKHKKRILTQGTELFNQRPEKGVQYLQENGILNSQLDSKEIALFLRENPGLDKKMIGDYISKKKNVESKILENFVQSFDFKNLRIDLALRQYLETFRLPGEAPLIFLVMEHFADHWHKCNGEPFANTDAAFRLAYAIIMLNMDQHNYNAKRLNVPMTPEDFLKNLRGLNGNKDFDQDMLLGVYNSIKNEEIVMPAEQTGIVRENYLWKVLLRRGAGKDAQYLHVNDSSYDKELFNIAWGPSLTALSFIFDKSTTEIGYQKPLLGFTKCACISAFYMLHDDFDALILTLCKFTTLLSNNQQLDTTMNDLQLTIAFGTSIKALSAVKIIFNLLHDYGDCLRDSWKNILEILIQLFKLKLLPKSLIEVEDFCEPNGRIQLHFDKTSQKSQQQKSSDIGLFSSLYSYLSSTDGQRQPTIEEQEIIKLTKKCIRDLQLEQIISDTKFIQYESLNELFKSIMNLIKQPSVHKSIIDGDLVYSEDVTVFWMEFLVKVIIQNRDRILPLWPTCRDLMYALLMNSSSYGYDYLLNRTTVALLKLAIYLMRNEELCPIVLQSLKMLLMLKPNVIYRISKQISIGIYELLKTSAQNIHTEADWQIIFTILECVGAGALPPEFEEGCSVPGGPVAPSTKSDGALSSEEDSGLPDRGYTSDSEVITAIIKSDGGGATISPSNTPYPSPSNGGGVENWILVNNKDSEISISSRPQSPIGGSSLVYPCKLVDHLPFALFKCWDSLSFIVRNVAHITPYNFESCVRCIRTFVEAVLDGGIKARRKLLAVAGKSQHLKKKSAGRRDSGRANNKRRTADEQSSDSEDEELSQRYETLAIQLLDLMYTLYTRTAQIFRWWAEEGCADIPVPQCSALWAQGWCPILQGIARLAIDRRREVRTYAISCLQQRALLVHDLQTLTGNEWASCFKQVLFPLLNELLPESSSILNLDPILLEESRIRTATIMSKVFLHHLTPLIELPTFNELWLEILDYIEKFMKIGSDMLYEQMLEILKNMLLVMHSVRIFHQYCNDGTTQHSPLWELTWKRIGEFLPNLRDDLFREDANQINVSVTHQQSSSNTVEFAENSKEPVTEIAGNSVESESSQQLTDIRGVMYPKDGTEVETVRVGLGGSSIILQPPIDTFSGKQLIFGQAMISSSPQHNVPLLVPQTTATLQQQQTYHTQQHQQPSFTEYSMMTSVENIRLASSPPTQLQQMYSNNQPPTGESSVMQSIPESLSQSVTPQHSHHPHHHQNDGRLPDLVPDNSISTQNCISSNTNISTDNTPHKESNVYQMNTNMEFANMIELSETPCLSQQFQQYTASDISNSNQVRDIFESVTAQQQISNEYTVNSSPPSCFLNSSTQNLCSQQNPFHNVNPINSTKFYSQQQQFSIPSNNSSSGNSLEENLSIQSKSELPSPRVPMSHLIAGNEYPSLKKHPPTSIVQSFTPVYIQPQQPQSGSDIYSEYVQNPYNLTLQQQKHTSEKDATTIGDNNNQTSVDSENSTVATTTTVPSKTTQVLDVSNVFQSANYFGGIDQNSIPPGSEMLFGKP